MKNKAGHSFDDLMGHSEIKIILQKLEAIMGFYLSSYIR